jgi:hypothetical protein
MICKSADANGFGCADLGKAFNGPDGLGPSGDLLADDQTHPSDKGDDAEQRLAGRASWRLPSLQVVERAGASAPAVGP